MLSAIASEPVHCATQAMMDLRKNEVLLSRIPTCPKTTALGNFEREVAELKKAAASVEQPKPAQANARTDRANANVWFDSRSKCDGQMKRRNPTDPKSEKSLIIL